MRSRISDLIGHAGLFTAQDLGKAKQADPTLSGRYHIAATAYFAPVVETAPEFCSLLAAGLPSKWNFILSRDGAWPGADADAAVVGSAAECRCSEHS